MGEAGEAGASFLPRLELAGFELVKVVVPLRSPWTSAAGTLAQRESLLVRTVGRTAAAGDEAEGWGECGALPWPTYTSEYTDGALAAARRFVVPSLLGQPASLAPTALSGPTVACAQEVAGSLSWLKGHNMVKAAFEMSLLDAQLRAAGRPLAAHLAGLSAGRGGPSATVPAGVVVGLAPSLAGTLVEIEGFVAQGYRRVKLKVVPGREVELVAEVRRRWPGLVLMVDANGAYASVGPVEAAAMLGPLADLDVSCVEQPLGADDLLGHAELARRTPVPLCLDEPLTSAAGVSLALQVGACSVVNIKAPRLGGYLEAVRAHDICATAGVAAWCGGMVDLGLGRAANVALAALPGFSLPGDISASSRFFSQDIATPVELGTDGSVEVPDGPGVGAGLIPGAVDHFACARSWHPAR